MKIMDKFVQCYTFGDIFKKSYLFLNSEARVAKQNKNPWLRCLFYRSQYVFQVE